MHPILYTSIIGFILANILFFGGGMYKKNDSEVKRKKKHGLRK